MSLCISPTCSNPQNPDNVLFCQTCGSELLLQGRYRVLRVLDSGGFGKTYEVKEGSTSKVLKVLMNTSPKAIELFQREAQVLSQLDHPGIPKVEYSGYFVFHPRDREPVHCLVMEKIDGDNLLNYIRQRGRPIDDDLARHWLLELVTILQQVHDRDILHRDIKPQNVILKPDGSLALIDFGAVRDGGETEVATRAARGTGTEVATHAKGGTSISSSGYTPIEQINGQSTKHSDFFALGRTFIYLLTGKEPMSMYVGSVDEVHWRDYASGVSKELADLIDSMQARLAKDRPANTQEILQRLTKIGRQTPSPPKPSPPPKSEPVPSPPSSRPTSVRRGMNPLMAIVIGLAVLGGIGFIALVVSSNSGSGGYSDPYSDPYYPSGT
jgi:serine/threonine protein kinase